jgi:transglutaminase-like putative cysteine protease
MKRSLPAASQQIPRISLTWLLVAQVLVILPLLLHLPAWVAALWLFCAGWRVQVFRMRARFANDWVRGALIFATGCAVFFSAGTLIGLDAGVLLLVCAFTLKLLELRSRRDMLVLIFLGFFVVVTAYLFDDGLLAALYSLLPVTALLAALIGLQQSALAGSPKATLKLAASLMLQAVPLMLLLFVFFPRLGPLWSLPNPNMAVTGLSDSMSPAEIADLSRSDALAFRASFDGDIPPRNRLYWRALTLERFDGWRWSQSEQSRSRAALEPQWRKQGQPYEYSIILQPSYKPWLPALDVGQTTEEGARLMADFHLERRGRVERSLLYRVSSWPQAQRQQELPRPLRELALQLPEHGNPRSRAWAAELLAAHPQPRELVAALLRHFHQEPYGYTLKPPPLGSDNIDGFLFDTRKGFCGHYAGAMTFVLRAAGIPARVVAGYQGGEVNPAGNYISVRQFDAHAWVEYWTPEQGWTSVDPTFEVAPERIEQNLEQAVAGEQSFLEDSPMSLLRYRGIAWLNDLRLTWDNINYGWQRWVLGYQAEQQLGLLQRWFGSLDWRLIATSLVGGGALLLGLLALMLFKPWQRERDPQQRAYHRFERLLARQGLYRQPGEGPRVFASRAGLALPAQAREIEAFVVAFEAQRYAGEPGGAALLVEHLSRLRRAMPWRRRLVE